MYMAPEIFKDCPEFGFPVDVYAFGMVTYVVLCGDKDSLLQSSQYVFPGKIMSVDRPEMPNWLGDGYRRLIESCLKF